MGSGKFRYILRIAVEITFFIVFAAILLAGFTQLWLVIFGIGVIASIVFDRFYCGWMCPIGTLARPIGWLYEKLGIDRRERHLHY